MVHCRRACGMFSPPLPLEFDLKTRPHPREVTSLLHVCGDTHCRHIRTAEACHYIQRDCWVCRWQMSCPTPYCSIGEATMVAFIRISALHQAMVGAMRQMSASPEGQRHSCPGTMLICCPQTTVVKSFATGYLASGVHIATSVQQTHWLDHWKQKEAKLSYVQAVPRK